MTPSRSSVESVLLILNPRGLPWAGQPPAFAKRADKSPNAAASCGGPTTSSSASNRPKDAASAPHDHDPAVRLQLPVERKTDHFAMHQAEPGRAGRLFAGACLGAAVQQHLHADAYAEQGLARRRLEHRFEQAGLA